MNVGPKRVKEQSKRDLKMSFSFSQLQTTYSNLSMRNILRYQEGCTPNGLLQQLIFLKVQELLILKHHSLTFLNEEQNLNLNYMLLITKKQ